MSYLATSTKRSRRTKADMETIRETIYDVLAADNPQTVRQVFYQLVSAGVVRKTEEEYEGTVCRLLGEMRRSEDLPYEWIVDPTRRVQRPYTVSSPAQALLDTVETYRRALWDDATIVPQIWLEKEALGGVLWPIADEWDVPLMVCKGYPSITFTHDAARAIGLHGEPADDNRTHIFYFGDNDPSGKDIDRSVPENIGKSLLAIYDVGEATPREAFDLYADFERVAVTPAQIKELNLPTRPTKQSDNRSKNFKGRSTELDAIPMATLRGMARSCIERHVEEHVDQDELDMLRKAERSERRVLMSIADKLIRT